MEIGDVAVNGPVAEALRNALERVAGGDANRCEAVGFVAGIVVVRAEAELDRQGDREVAERAARVDAEFVVEAFVGAVAGLAVDFVLNPEVRLERECAEQVSVIVADAESNSRAVVEVVARAGVADVLRAEAPVAAGAPSDCPSRTHR